MSNKAFVKILKSAKKELRTSDDVKQNGFWTYREHHICFAINRAEGYNINSTSIKDVIHNRLGKGNSTVEEFLIKNKHITRDQAKSKKTRALIQDYRHAWVDELIREFS